MWSPGEKAGQGLCLRAADNRRAQTSRLSLSLSLNFCSPEITTSSLTLFPQHGPQSFTQAEAGPAAPQGHLG